MLWQFIRALSPFERWELALLLGLVLMYALLPVSLKRAARRARTEFRVVGKQEAMVIAKQHVRGPMGQELLIDVVIARKQPTLPYLGETLPYSRIVVGQRYEFLVGQKDDGYYCLLEATPLGNVPD